MSDEQVKRGGDQREDVPDMAQIADLLFPKDSAYYQMSRDWDMTDQMYYLKLLRMVEVRAGFHPLDDMINHSGLPVEATLVEGYSWNDLKSWMSDPTVSVIAYIPRHAVLVFAVGSDSKGRYRHALIGRASGGQSPCTWVPWSKEDVHPDEDFWSGAFTNFSSESDITQKNISPLYMSYGKRGGMHQAVITKRLSHLEYQPHPLFKDFEPPEWLQSTELICDTCMLHQSVGDSVSHPQKRREALNSDQ